jgi:hypothetical protein
MKWPRGRRREWRHRSKLKLVTLPFTNWRLWVSGLATLTCQCMVWKGRAIAQAVNCQLPATAAWVWPQVRSHGNCGRQSGTVAGFLRVLRLTLPISPAAPHSTTGQIVANIPSGLSLTPTQGLEFIVPLKTTKLLCTGSKCGTFRSESRVFRKPHPFFTLAWKIMLVIVKWHIGIHAPPASQHPSITSIIGILFMWPY